MVILLMAISSYSINGYCGYSIGGCQWRLYEWLLVAIILMATGGYSINGYLWLFY